MIVFRCDVCKRDQPSAESLKSGNVRVSLGSLLVANLANVDRCISCYENMIGSLKTMVQSIDDTKSRMDSDPNVMIPESIHLEAPEDFIDTGATADPIPWPDEGGK